MMCGILPVYGCWWEQDSYTMIAMILVWIAQLGKTKAMAAMIDFTLRRILAQSFAGQSTWGIHFGSFGFCKFMDLFGP